MEFVDGLLLVSVNLSPLVLLVGNLLVDLSLLGHQVTLETITLSGAHIKIAAQFAVSILECSILMVEIFDILTHCSAIKLLEALDVVVTELKLTRIVIHHLAHR